MVDDGVSAIAHLKADLAEAKREITLNKNYSADWWRSRAAALAHAIEVIKAEERI